MNAEKSKNSKKKNNIRNLVVATVCIVISFIFVVYASEKVTHTAEKEVYTTISEIPMYEMGDKEILGKWQRGEEFLTYDKYTRIVYYPSGNAFISENGKYVRYVQEICIEVE